MPIPTPMSDEQKRAMENRPSRFGKSTLVTNAFLAECIAGKSAVFESPVYVCLSRKALENMKDQSFHQGVQAEREKMIKRVGFLRQYLNERKKKDLITNEEIEVMLDLSHPSKEEDAE